MKNLFSVIMLVYIFVISSVQANDFPGREKFPEISIYSKEQLKKNYDKVIIVDARSKLEFETLRVKNAINIPVASNDFTQRVAALRKKSKDPIVFYCNGHTCFKSYIAAKKANKANIANVFAYDEGLFSWARTYPNESVLLGQSPIDTKHIISKTAFKQRLLNPTEFSDLAFKSGSKKIIVDVRDRYQRGASGFFPGKEKWVSMDEKEKMTKLFKKAVDEKKTLFIYDETGKQVRWLQYALEQNNVTNYFFMKKGAKAFYQEMMEDFGIKKTAL